MAPLTDLPPDGPHPDRRHDDPLHVLAGQTRHGIAESKRLIERRSADLQAVRDRIAATRDRIEASEQAFAVLDPSGRAPHDERNGGGWL